MDAKKTGKLIAKRRRELGLTQKELAQRIYVSDKAVSRWETGKGFPELALLQVLSEALGISVDELLQGEERQEKKEPEAGVCGNDIHLEAYVRPHTKLERGYWNGLAIRRFLGRLVDMQLYGFICSVFVYKVCGGLPVYEWLIVAAVLYLMVIVEPFLLHIFGTTPGKYLFGIRVLGYQDRRLSVRGGWDRTIKVLVFGMGLHVPIVSLVCLFISYLKARRNEPLGWEVENKLVDVQPLWWKKIVGVLGIAACLFGMALMQLHAFLPRYCGADISVWQLRENYHRYLRFYGIAEAPELEVEQEEDAIKEVVLAIDGAKGWDRDYDGMLNSAVWSYIGAQDEAVLEDVMESLDGMGSAAISIYDTERVFEYAGIKASLQIVDKSVKPEKEVKGAIEPGEEDKYAYRLVMEKSNVKCRTYANGM